MATAVSTATPLHALFPNVTWSVINPNTTTIHYPMLALCCSGTTSLLSILGAICIIWTFCTIPEIRNFTRKLMLCLTLADLLSALGYFISVIQFSYDKHQHKDISHVLCLIQGFVTTYSSMVSFFLTVFIAIHIFLTVVYRDNRTGSTTWFVVFNLVSWIIPGVITIAAISEGVFGEKLTNNGATGPWCWIVPKYETKYIIWMFAAGKFWEIACYLITMCLYVLLKFYMCQKHRDRTLRDVHVSLRAEDKNYMFVWFVLYVIRIWGTVRFFLMIFYKNDDSKATHARYALLILQSIGDPAQGFCNFVLFCILDKIVRKRLSNVLRNICKRNQNEEMRRLLND